MMSPQSFATLEVLVGRTVHAVVYDEKAQTIKILSSGAVVVEIGAAAPREGPMYYTVNARTTL